MHLSLSDISFTVVDDSTNMRRIIVTMLRGFGARRIVEAEDGVDGLEKIEMNAPDIVISDWVMPVLDGGEMVKMIRTPDFSSAHVSIIMLTAYTEKSRVLQSMDLGVDHVLCKPVSARSLYDRIADCVLRPRNFIKTDTYFGPEPRDKRRDGAVKGTEVPMNEFTDDSVDGESDGGTNEPANQTEDTTVGQDDIDAMFA